LTRNHTSLEEQIYTYKDRDGDDDGGEDRASVMMEI
jgi:hypothetical protein